ncbi:pyridoxamine 5'-phosphate oxidase [Arachidicoccus ginsenosidimutans]|uniref:pyridoxamine 5'-phosphate oxidase n=1 Tax=Arachidicoccus sp. BS20 TaxID=1850526 RepID=UPI0007F16884|nr:pyridoxamine 5'-phosphate oxidase [Arachidicoccus sp. BS20]ANI88630.1 pyridoxamine 5'-phosphate oxidase [Arachidicoccus sp. BS20]
MNIANIRTDYKLMTLNESDVLPNAIAQFDAWWQQAVHSEIEEVNAMTLATVSSDGKPDARIVLLKNFSEEGFEFFTNYNSAKGKELAENPYACLVFFWKELERQVRITGRVKKVSAARSDEYFYSRPAGSRVGAWSSPQSEVIASREVLEANEKHFKEQFGEDIPRPEHWGGYAVMPESIEFWQGRSNRLHDRLLYTLENGTWKIKRLAP